ncbi:hypothetical protein, conserved [Trypanosoma brucei brucei TREU927]|uniref:Derlin n=1 Tax=Trypanosoma brucei brucei (strain 927/4 GUTat10.1) TaxID=185431 RepID=Q382S2_TRYB2|nr:hypothetical protein, conserved [Trypanosoma brucei brucei TREU927]EAN80209.1 hypothetical protein, conserved [Trypanosoma brucei brucei TREU927]
MAQSFDDWLQSLNPVTKGVFAAAVLLTAAISMHIAPYTYFTLDTSAIMGLQLWRPFTAALFFGKFSFPWLIAMAMFVSYLKYNEEYDYQGKTADFAWMLILVVIGLTAGGLLLGLPIVSGALLMALCWVFCKRHPQLRMKLYSFEFDAKTFPWVLALFHFILGQNILEDALGIVVGHLFFFLNDLIPLKHGTNPIATPSWFVRLTGLENGGVRFGGVHAGGQAFAARFARQPPPAAAGGRPHHWGPGHRLGTT